ncbi:hypothetical protein FGO68_gene17200 [Halteria grandinella]|uniref:ApaG domain-containing protein n=1 Tax=Halteria grandinella TaxID=5974 RepID=A0A8J8SVB8_HALGN|nr:hypothetical protein FGO68_gene17200 [Halteria grandinella]
MGTSLIGYLETHCERVQSGQLMEGRGRVEGFPKNPGVWGGSVTVTNSIEIQAVAKFLHYFSILNHYTFVYQIRIRMTKESAPVQLTRRHWDVKDGESISVVEGEGVIGQYPIILAPSESPAFLYESCSTMSSLVDSQISGWLEFKYLEGEKKDQVFQARVEPFKLALQEGQELMDTPYFEDWMNHQ